MNRFIENIYNYLDYRLLLNDDFMLRSAKNHSYSLRAYSRDLILSPGFLSDVLRGNKELSVSKARDIFKKIGLESDELVYAENLIMSKIGTDEIERFTSRSYILQHYNRTLFKIDDSKTLFAKSAEHFIIYGLIRKVSQSHLLKIYTEKIGIASDTLQNIINEYLIEGYIKEVDGSLYPVDENVALGDNINMLRTISDYSHIIAENIIKQGGNKIPERMGHAFVIPLDQMTFDLIQEAHKHYMKTVFRISKQTEKVDRFLLMTDLFLIIDQNPMPSSSNLSL